MIRLKTDGDIGMDLDGHGTLQGTQGTNPDAALGQDNPVLNVLLQGLRDLRRQDGVQQLLLLDSGVAQPELLLDVLVPVQEG